MGEIRTGGRRGRHDLIVVPLTPFLSFREGHEASDLSRFADLARRPPNAPDHRTQRDRARWSHVLHVGPVRTRWARLSASTARRTLLPDDTMALGDDLPVFRTDFGVLGLTLSTDFYFPEVYGVLWMKGAEILIWQHSPERFREHFQWVPLLKARALDSRVASGHGHVRRSSDLHHQPLRNRDAGSRLGAQHDPEPRGHARLPTPATKTASPRQRSIWTNARLDPYSPWKRDENIFLVNNLGDRKAFRPLAEPWTKPELPAFKKRKARIAVGYFWGRDSWRRRQCARSHVPCVGRRREMSARLRAAFGNGRCGLYGNNAASRCDRSPSGRNG